MGGAIRRIEATSNGETNGYIKGDHGIIGSPPGNIDSHSAADAAQFPVPFAQLLVPDKHTPMIDKTVKGKNLIQKLPPIFFPTTCSGTIWVGVEIYSSPSKKGFATKIGLLLVNA